jgi:hypothetical protein
MTLKELIIFIASKWPLRKHKNYDKVLVADVKNKCQLPL